MQRPELDKLSLNGGVQMREPLFSALPRPFTLSLSKGCTQTVPDFDKLSPNGVWNIDQGNAGSGVLSMKYGASSPPPNRSP